jgi:hypothetical protein
MAALVASTGTIPICWKCRNAVTKEPAYGGIFDPNGLIGCRADETIKSYAQAKVRCPVILDLKRGG